MRPTSPTQPRPGVRAGAHLFVLNRAMLSAVFVLVCTSVLLAAGIEAKAEVYPSPVTLVVPWPPGSSPDGIARILGPSLADRLGKPFIVENRPGAS